MSSNPWGLTPRQVQVMDAMVEHGCRKHVAAALGLGEETVKDHLSRAAKKMPGHRRGVQRFIAWDRWRRGQLTEEA